MRSMPTIYDLFSSTISIAVGGFVLYTNYKAQKERCLGQKLQSYSVREIFGHMSPNNPQDLETYLELIIHNPTNQIIKINHIKIPKEYPFVFNKVCRPDPNEAITDSERDRNGIKVIPKTPKHIDLIDPKLKPEHLGFFDLFSIKAKSKLTLWFKIHPKEPSFRKPIIIVVEHTSCNDPEATLETKFCLGFFRWTDQQNETWFDKLFKRKLFMNNSNS